MLTNIIFMCIIASGSAFCATKYDKKFEEILPITCMGIGMILFLFGVIGFLKIGVYVVILISVILYIITLVRIIKSKSNWYIFAKNFFSVGFIFYSITSIVLSILLHNQLASNWDEFSHWMDIVKVMTTLDDFGTNAQSFSMFKSYPPAMTLFQYMFQKVFLLVNPGQTFIEWRVYLAYQLYFIGLFLPLFRYVKHREYLKVFSLASIIYFLPLCFYRDVYYSLYIDPFLAILAGIGFALVIIYDRKDKDIFYSIYVWLIIATLILTKDAGIIFAIFLALFYMIDYFLYEYKIKKEVFTKYSAFHLLISILSIFVPKMLWKWKLKITGATIVFETHIDFKVLFNVLTGKDDSYRVDVLKNYIYGLFEQYLDIGYTNIRVNYIMLFIILIFSLYIVLKFQVKKGIIIREEAMVCGFILLMQLVVFIIGMCIIYIFNFSEYEAVNLASFSRYMNIAFFATALPLFLLIWKTIILSNKSKIRIYLLYFIFFMLLITPLIAVVDILSKKNFETAYEWRQKYNMITDKIMDICDGDDLVYVISQEDAGIDRFVIKYNIRPNRVQDDYVWSIGQPFYDGDIWTTEKTAEEWQEELKEYDYVALYGLNDYFYENFSCIFAESEDIYEGGLYKVEKASGRLYLIN